MSAPVIKVKTTRNDAAAGPDRHNGTKAPCCVPETECEVTDTTRAPGA
jgi:hypothetical protein